MTKGYILHAVLLLASLAALTPAARGQGAPTCGITAGTLHGSGLIAPVVPAYGPGDSSVLVADIFMYCAGGMSIYPGPIPTIDLTVFFNADVLGTTQPEVMMDSPGSSSNPNVLLCSSLAGCPMDSTPPGVEPYDGSPGRPNVFLGTIGGISANQVEFYGLPVEFPVVGGDLLIIQVTGITIDTSSLSPSFPPSFPPFSPGAAVASLSINSSFSFAITSSTLEVAMETTEPSMALCLGLGLAVLIPMGWLASGGRPRKRSPSGVPGAYRLLGNLVSLSTNPAWK